ncbi:MAG: hypothetical protein CL706_06945 [Chloroflexi bacterium]|nr:hypothetical protein [Chloroflexota bacterium]
MHSGIFLRRDSHFFNYSNTICYNFSRIKWWTLGSANLLEAKQWHPEKNGNLSPYDVTPGSTEEVWWSN